MNLTESAIDLLKQRYCSHGETPKDVFPRVAKALASQMNGDPDADKFLSIMENMDFLPNSPCIRNAGYSNQVKACFVLPIEDSMESIFKTLQRSALVFKSGGGVGYNFSKLREKGATLSHGGTSSGVMSFLKIYNAITEAVKQGGFRRGACCLPNVRALTPFGWRYYKDLKIGEKILTYNPEKQCNEFQPILRLNVFDWNDNVIHIDNKFLDITVTPNHRVLYKLGTKAKYHNIAPAGDLPKMDLYIPTNAYFGTPTKDTPMTNIPGQKDWKKDDLIKLIAWIITEGSKKGSGFDISQNEKVNPENCKELDELWDRLGFPITKNDTKHYLKNGERIWHIPSEFCMHNIFHWFDSNHKTISSTILIDFSIRQLQVLFDELMKGDGHRQETWGKYTTKTEISADRFLELCTKLGYRASKKPYKIERDNKVFAGFNININFKRKHCTVKSNHITTEYYKGKVWCPTVENGFWVCESNGYVSITGNSMGVLDVDHPEILDFIKEKLKPGSMNNFNLSVMVTDDFMKGIENDDKIYTRSRLDRRIITSKFNCRDLFNIISYSAWLTGDPGLLFYDRINKDNPYYPKYEIKSTNPCGEVPLLPYESCCLGSINLANFVTNDGGFDTVRFSEVVRIGTKFLMAMNKICEFPIDECYIAQAKYLRIGLGVMGFADMLMKMGIYYDSNEALDIIDTIGKIMQESKKYSPQSVATLSIAPTGSLSILANCSSGIEPWFAPSYTRHLTFGEVKESRQSKYLRTSHQISPDWHLKIQAKWQSYIDNGVSKTINLPNNATIQDIQDIYMKAWKMGCKGITIFRDGCLGDSGQVLRGTCDGESCHL